MKPWAVTMAERLDIDQVLLQMRTLRTQLQPPVQTVAPNAFAQQYQQQLQAVSDANSNVAVNRIDTTAPVSVESLSQDEVASFAQMFRSAINQVNDHQLTAAQMAKRYEMGDQQVDLPEVMIALQKSSVSFQAMTQVRNKMIDAYKEIMNMPI